MPWYDFIWNRESGGNALHIAEHGIAIEDAEAIVCSPIATVFSRATGRPMATGVTTDGRLVVVVYEFIDGVTVYVITAFEVDA
ncbi:MAG: hypothetical protein ACKOEX_02060 [Planctomycetia bacterium]